MDYFSGKQEGLTDDVADERAIKNISFGKHREDMGYGTFKTKHSKDSTNIYTDAQGNVLEQPLENVPKKTGIDSYLADQKKLDATLEKYKELHKGSKIDEQ